MYPRQSPTTHTEQLGDEASVYDWARVQVHALNPTAACVWQQCDGATSPDAIAAVLSQELGIPEAEAVADLTLRQLARLHLLELPAGSRGDRPATSRRWLLGRGVAAAMLPAIYSIVAPSPVEAQSPGPGAPTLTSVSPNQGFRGTTVAVTLTGTSFVHGATTVTVGGGGVTVTSVTVGSSTSLTASFVLDLTAAAVPHAVTVTTAGGTSGAQTFTIILPRPGSTTFTYTGSPETFTVPAGVVRVTIQATGAQGGAAAGTLTCFRGPVGRAGPAGRTTATVGVTPGATLTVLVGSRGMNRLTGDPSGGFNGGGNSAGGGGGGGASSVFAGATPLVIAGGGGGAGSACSFASGDGGSGGGLIADPGESLAQGGGGGGGTQVAGGTSGAVSPGSSTGTPGTPGVAGMGGSGGNDRNGAGGGGGGGYFGGGGGGGGNQPGVGGSGGGGGSSYAAPSATAFVHEKRVFGLGDGLVTISW